jgi:phosphoribosyl 1,2-cyclic phosphodiesterase
VEIKFWGVRGSVPVANRRMMRYGGNTSCVQVTLADGTELILDAGTGIRELGAARAPESETVEVLLTHLHVDHIHGLLFFPPLFDSRCRITVYGPASPGPSLERRLGRYLSAPLSPLDLRELPARVKFVACPYLQWRIGDATIAAAIVAHRGVTLGYRITEGATSLCYLPDHEPSLGADLSSAERDWISGLGLAANATVLIHDGQYSEREYPGHEGWGHSSIPDAIAFALRAEVEQLILSHHDPAHDDQTLDQLADEAKARWQEAGQDPRRLQIAHEGLTLRLP